MPIEAEHGGDESNAGSFKEKSEEHKQHRSNEGLDGPKLGAPVLVERDATDGNHCEYRPEGRHKTTVPRGGQVAEVVDCHVGNGGNAQSTGPSRQPPHGGGVSLIWIEGNWEELEVGSSEFQHLSKEGCLLLFISLLRNGSYYYYFYINFTNDYSFMIILIF